MSANLPPFPDLDTDSGTDLSRHIGLSDGIFGFSMTLLAVNISLPDLPPHSDVPAITAHIEMLVPLFLVYALSFLLVGLYWQVHRRVFSYITGYDAVVTWLNILQLLFVAFLPVATGLYQTYSEIPIVIVLYTGTLVAIGIVGQLLWHHVIGPANLVDPSLTPVLKEYYSFRGYATILVYVVMLLVGLVEPVAARWVLVGLVVIYPFLNRVYRLWWQWRHPNQYA